MSGVSPETRKEELAAARKEGETDALLREHSKHLAEINGSVGDAAKALAVLTAEVHDLSLEGQRALRDVQHKLEDAIRAAVGEIRKLQEELRIRDERVSTARDTLATETERRREDLAVTADALDRATAASDRGEKRTEFKITRWQALVIATASLLFGIVGLVLGHPWR